ncbi:MAG: hypothetical protein AABY18_06900 [Candidatus Thermoplasmatota archaeon]
MPRPARSVDAALAQLPGMSGWTGLPQATAQAIIDAEGREPGLAAWSCSDYPLAPMGSDEPRQAPHQVTMT